MPKESNGAERPQKIVEIWSRRILRDGKFDSFLPHNLHIILGPSFPESPYLSCPSALAIMEQWDALPIRGVHDLRVNVIANRNPRSDFVKAALNSPLAESMVYFSTEENGLPVPLEANPENWRKFALAIDFARTDEDLTSDFQTFVRDAREQYGLPTEDRPKRPSRSGLPTWMTKRYAEDSLRSLGALRLIEAFSRKPGKALKYARQKRKGLPFTAPASFQRSARRTAKIIEKLFGAAWEIETGGFEE